MMDRLSDCGKMFYCSYYIMGYFIVLKRYMFWTLNAMFLPASLCIRELVVMDLSY